MKYFLILSLALSPVYLYPSGGPQLVDILILLVIFLTLFYRKTADAKIIKQIYTIIPFFVWVLLINSIYFLQNSEDISLFIATITLLYNIIIFYAFSKNFSEITGEKAFKILSFGLILSILLVFLIKGKAEEEIRATLSFNNPNQLGYFSVILFSYVIIFLNNKDKLNILSTKSFWVSVILISLAAHFFVFLSLSRGAFFSILLLDICFLKTMIKNKYSFMVAMLMMILGAIIIFSNLPYIEGRMKARGESRSFNLEKSIAQSYERVSSQLMFSNSWQIFWGRGDGRIIIGEGQFLIKPKNDPIHFEVHNIFGNVLRSYGIIGLFLFGFWIGKFIWESRFVPGAIWVWAALLCYNMTHNGIRFRSFWILLAFILALTTHLKTDQEKRFLALQGN